MKSYPEIPGPSKAPNLPCIAFDKKDGSNLRFLYHKKRGWSRFGTRNCLFDANHEVFGCAIDIFYKTYAESIERIIKDNKAYRGVEELIAFCEFFGKNSFCGWHDPQDPKELLLFDINVHKKGFVPPREFVNNFSSVGIPNVVYEGNFGKQLVEDVKDGKYPVYEGVVVKGMINPKKIWMAKIKTKQWLEDLKTKAQTSEQFRRFLSDNQKEQENY